ncbi:uncharacterized protein LOC110599895 isoform X1 [Manihot esculenta]|uniref:Uncharacterized protein n=1 Tax=Manihot esculenta TaxID=3983 RepID=A0ACB7GES2_MANES|nr:uncharacterized protein LOC110599895 isoform X1 [Manihot esculenta]KAG8638727.1 hypothetical protein MANES_14G054500v8 [Manihot esculenta]
MATSAFRSTTKRTPIAKSSASSTDDSSSSNRSSSAHRRSRSLSRFSRPLPPSGDDLSGDAPLPRARFVNNVRGSGFPDVTLDDLAVQFFGSADRGRSYSRIDDVSSGDKVSVSQRRGRSVSRHGSRVGEGKANGRNGYVGGRVNFDNNSRRRRSVSVVRYQISDSESDIDHSQNPKNHTTLKSHGGGSCQVVLSNKTANHKQGLRRSLSQKDLKYQDGYSSHSSVLTDDEWGDSDPNVTGIGRTIQALYTQKEAMRKPNTSLESDNCKQPKNFDVLQGVSTTRRNYATKMKLSERRKQGMLSEILLEEQHRRELSKAVKELLGDPNDYIVKKSLQAKKKSSDRSRMSNQLTEEAERYIEGFISNFEDTDVSSLDGERSDTSSSLGGMSKMLTFQSPVLSKSIPVEMDGIVLPWLQWETSNDASPLSSKTSESVATPTTNLWEATQDATLMRDLSNHSISSRGSWSSRVIDGHSSNIGEVTGNRFAEVGSCYNQFSSDGTRPQPDVDDYLQRRREEAFLFERWSQQQRIQSGGLLLCNQMFF